jgi:ribose 5-phosphate isomerase B
MKIALGSDHAGYDGDPPHYKPEIAQYLESKGYAIVDCGTHNSDAVDYPDIARAVCKKILDGDAEKGVLICGTGIGVSMTANRHPGIRAAVCTNVEMGRLSREHNDANILCLGRRVISLEECKAIIDVWLNEPASTIKRHVNRVTKMG